MQTTVEERIKMLMEKYPDLFPTESSFWTYLRGSLRRGLWEKSAMKIKFKQSTATPPPNDYKGRGKKGHYCALTGVWVPISKSQVDHVNGNVPLSKEDDIVPFIIHLLATDDELQVVEKEAHKVKSYAERRGISFEEALIEKKVIAICKSKRDKEWLTENGITPASNQAKRKAQIKEVLNERRLS